MATRKARSAVRLAIVVCMLSGFARTGFGRDVPALEHRVTDLAQLLTPQEDSALEERLKAYENQTGRQFALLTVPTLDGEPLEMFSIRVVERWKLGRKGEDDGLLLLIAAQEQRMRIEVGYRLEPTVTDALSSQVIRTILQPAFRSGTYADGISRAFPVFMAAADKEPVTGLLPQDRSNGSIWPTHFHSYLFWCSVVALIILGRIKERKKPLSASQAPTILRNQTDLKRRPGSMISAMDLVVVVLAVTVSVAVVAISAAAARQEIGDGFVKCN